MYHTVCDHTDVAPERGTDITISGRGGIWRVINSYRTVIDHDLRVRASRVDESGEIWSDDDGNTETTDTDASAVSPAFRAACEIENPNGTCLHPECPQLD